MSMDSWVNIITILLGLAMLHSSYKLMKYKDLKMLYDTQSYAHIKKRYLDDYALSMGRILGVLGLCFIISSFLFFIKGSLFFIMAQIILLGSIVGSIIAIVIVNKKYQK